MQISNKGVIRSKVPAENNLTEATPANHTIVIDVSQRGHVELPIGSYFIGIEDT